MASMVRSLAGVFNPLAMPVASSGLVPVWGVVRHTGRRSGRSFATPIALASKGDVFFVPLPWGERTDWCRNVVAARGGVVRYRGRDHRVVEPVVVSAAAAAPAFPRIIRPVIARVGIKTFLRLRRADGAPDAT